MLTLTRKIGETIFIGDNIKLTVMSVSKQQGVRLAITSPLDVKVHRQELYEQVKNTRCLKQPLD